MHVYFDVDSVSSVITPFMDTLNTMNIKTLIVGTCLHRIAMNHKAGCKPFIHASFNITKLNVDIFSFNYTVVVCINDISLPGEFIKCVQMVLVVFLFYFLLTVLLHAKYKYVYDVIHTMS